MLNSEVIAPENFFHINEELPKINPDVLGHVGIFSIANSTATIILIALIFASVSLSARSFTLVPRKFQGFCEVIYEAILSFITQIMGDREHAKKMIPFVGSLMVYLAVANLLPIIPFLASVYMNVKGEHIAVFRGATTDFNTTFGLAVAVVGSMQFLGMKEQGVFGYLSHFVRVKQVFAGFRKGLASGGEALIGFFVGLIELVSEIAKMLSLSLRLFGNMFAHEVLTVILLGVFSFVLPVVWIGMGVLVGLVQAIVFSALVTIYYSLVLKQEH